MSSAVTCLCVIVCLASVCSAADEGIPEPDALFKQLDADGDGQLTAGEVSEDKRPMFERLVRKADGNDDGKLSLSEFQAAHKEDDSPNLPLTGGGRPNRGGDIRQRFEMLDRNKDGKVTRDEVPEQARRFLAPLFERLGKDELTIEDFRRLGQPGGNASPQGGEMRIPPLMRLLDANRDGRVSKSEWAKAGEVFAQLDANGDSELDPRELMGPPGNQMAADREAMERPNGQGRPASSDRGNFFARLDSNKDGKLSRNEAPPRMKDRFDQLDSNKDGQLTPEELQSGNPGEQPNRNERPARPKRPAAE